MRTAFAFVISEVSLAFFAVFNAAGASVSRTIFFTFFVVLLEMHGISITAKSVSNDTTTIVVDVLFIVLATSGGHAFVVVVVVRSLWCGANPAASVLIPRFALVFGPWCLLSGHFRGESGSARESLAVASPAIVSTFAIGTGAFAWSALGRLCAAFVLFPSLTLVRCGLSGHPWYETSLASERFAVTSPTINTTFTIRAGACVGNAVSKPAWAACVFFPGFFVELRSFARHFWAVATTACESFSISSPAVMLAIGSRTGTQVWSANCIIFTLAPSWSAVIIVSSKFVVFETCVIRALHPESTGTRFVTLEGTAVIVLFAIFLTLGRVVSFWGLCRVARVIVCRVLLPFVGTLPTDVRRLFQPVTT